MKLIGMAELGRSQEKTDNLCQRRGRFCAILSWEYRRKEVDECWKQSRGLGTRTFVLGHAPWGTDRDLAKRAPIATYAAKAESRGRTLPRLGVPKRYAPRGNSPRG